MILQLLRSALLILFLFTSILAQEPQSFISGLPSGQQWMYHLRESILPFWTMNSALGEPIGNFPTFRCNDGQLFDPRTPCDELKNAPDWMSPHLGKEFLRMKSRQTYLYGVAFHLTGEERFLKLMRKGVEFIRKQGIDREFGGAYTYWEGGKPDQLGFQRTSQDLAYAQIGLAFYYYLTRDSEVFKDITFIKNFIFDNYRDPETGLMLWTKDGPDREKRELVALLDQVNAYMLLLTPILPTANHVQDTWKRDLKGLAERMRNHFYDAETGLLWGAIDKADYRRIGGHIHNDFGHTIKAYWMMYFIGRLTNDKELENFARQNGERIINWAYLRSTGSWASRPNADDTLDHGKDWWIYAELDQATATFGLSTPEYFRYLVRTYRFWLDNQVDHCTRDVWHRIEPDSCRSDVSAICWKSKFPKVHFWKNGYHVIEHILMAYITGQALRKEPITLYFAFQDGEEKAYATPYYFSPIQEQRYFDRFEDMPGLKKVKIVFTEIE
jgi:mannose/cellobiose epimerase-like protein (N-acyl-D-glucosamine 2-epimerase family)